MLSLFALRGITPVQHSERRGDVMLPAVLLPLADRFVRLMLEAVAAGFSGQRWEQEGLLGQSLLQVQALQTSSSSA